jgi:predicted nucleic acid-binding protein
MVKPKVFVDSSCIISALLSSTGGSYFILTSLQNDFEFQVNDYGIGEIQDILTTKFAAQTGMQTQFFLLLGNALVTVLPSPSKQEAARFTKYISENDAPILASAIKHCDYLLTLDNEFFNEKITTLARKNDLHIVKPKEFLENSLSGLV